MQSLERLNLSGNHISHIPTSIAKLKRLRIFRISRNELHTIRDLRNLSSLGNYTAINFTSENRTYSNNVAYVPTDYLARLSFEDNPISELPHSRLFAVYFIPSLEVVDEKDISINER